MFWICKSCLKAALFMLYADDAPFVFVPGLCLWGKLLGDMNLLFIAIDPINLGLGDDCQLVPKLVVSSVWRKNGKNKGREDCISTAVGNASWPAFCYLPFVITCLEPMINWVLYCCCCSLLGVNDH